MSDSVDAFMVRLLLNYDPDTGEFRWRHREGDDRFNTMYENKEAGTASGNGYIKIGVKLSGSAKVYSAHRLAWLHYYGRWPEGVIDHIDKIKTNNAVKNLRDLNRKQNNLNRNHRIGESGVRGVVSSRNKWSSEGYINERLHRFGIFQSIEEASLVYENAMRNHISSECQTCLSPLRERKKIIPKSKEKIAHLRLLEIIHYDYETGNFHRIDRNGVIKKQIAGSHLGNGGYAVISVDGTKYYSHVLAWFYMTGKWSESIIDHIDGNRTNNKFSNLREATRFQNAINRKVDCGRGIRPTRNKIKRWEARISWNGKSHQLGTFDTREAAEAAWNDFVAVHCAEYIRMR